MTEIRLNREKLLTLEVPTANWKWIKVSRLTGLRMVNLPQMKIFQGSKENEDRDKYNLM